MNNKLPYSEPNIVDLSKELVNKVLSKKIYDVGETLTEGIESKRRIIFFLLDGLGNHQLGQNKGILFNNRKKEIRTTFPSTTNVVLSSFCTASMPREHGILSYFMYDNDFGGIFNALVWNKIDENRKKGENYLTTKTIWEIFNDHKLFSTVLQPKDLSMTTLSKNIYRGANVITYDSCKDLFIQLNERKNTLSKFTFVYYPPIDLAGHIYGSNSEEYSEEIKLFEENFQKFLPNSKEFAKILTSDHGIVDIKQEKRIRVDSSNTLVRFFGDNRAVFINGDIDEAKKLLEMIPGEFIDQNKLNSLLGYGPKHPEYELRVPQHCFLPNQDFAVVPSHLNDTLIGYHGGQSEQETLVPLIIYY